MKSSESLESRLTSFLLESALKLADLISADVFVLIDSPKSGDGIDGSGDADENHHQHHHYSRGARIWSGASSLRSAFLRDGLRVRETDVEFFSPRSPHLSTSPASGFGRVDASSSRVVDGCASSVTEIPSNYHRVKL